MAPDPLNVTELFKFRREIGRGAYGSVWAAKEIASQKDMAIKKVGARNFDEAILTKRALRELKLLRHLNGHDNVAKFVGAYLNKQDTSFTELYIVEGLMEADLSSIIKSGQKLTNQHFQYFLYQLLRGLKWMHSADIIHRDLKPGNLLVNSDCELRICDFGLARGINEVNAHLVNTEYVATRYYRAPEVVLSPKHYSKALDIWSVGCIFGEMLNGKIVFKGANYIDQLSTIFDILGTPQDPTLVALCSARVLKFIRTLPVRQKASFSLVFPRADQYALSLIDAFLTFDPSKRITAEQALNHPYLAQYHIPDDEPSHPRKCDFSFEDASTIPEIKKLIVEEVAACQAGSLPLYENNTSPKRSAIASPEIDEKQAQQAPKEEMIEAVGPSCIEEELQMQDLKLE